MEVPPGPAMPQLAEPETMTALPPAPPIVLICPPLAPMPAPPVVLAVPVVVAMVLPNVAPLALMPENMETLPAVGAEGVVPSPPAPPAPTVMATDAASSEAA